MKRGVFLSLLSVLLLAGCSSAGNREGVESAAVGDTAAGNRYEAASADSAAAEEPAAKQSGRSVAKDRAPSEPYPPSRPSGTNGMYFDHAGTNPFIAAEEDPLSTFSVDVDTGSYTIVRNYVNRGELPPEDAVRVEEFVNYFDIDYAPPRGNKAFAVHVDGGDSPFGDGYKLVRVALKGKQIEDRDRKPEI
ncbi:von Willebrand factor type A domain-containing protein [Paenibacillus thermotolerans]|uniref:von Willebrand factor type A domain-containing protein n=1 Tax=Paenibacillus thermotolerans TaxID=3027807 RepID=UPI002368DAD2|nr:MULTISPECIES: von Willebrand factor type A domain-containing protein [unclassified Paenibacillus]